MTGLEDFKQHLIAAGKSKRTLEQYMQIVRRFLKHTGESRIDRISEDLTRSFFAVQRKTTLNNCVPAITEFLTFAAARLPVPITRGKQFPRAAAPTKKEVALRQRWNLDKLIEQKENSEDLIAKLARKLIDHYLYFQGRMKGEPENLDEVYRFAAECKELIESNLELFMKLSAEGRNVHSKIDERVSI